MDSRTGNQIVITGLGVVSAASCNVHELYDALLTGANWIAPLEQSWAQPPYDQGASIFDFGAKERIEARRLRRMNRLSQMAVVAGMQALLQANLEGDSSLGVILGTGLGAIGDTVCFIDQLVNQEPALANPSLFPNSVMNIATSQISIEFGLQGFSTTINHKEASAELAVHTAANTLQMGRADALLVGGVEELSAPVHHGYRRLDALSKGLPQLYGEFRDGISLGEGGAIVAMETKQRAQLRGVPVIAELAGIGTSGGESPLVGWGSIQGPPTSSVMCAGIRAIRQALENAEMEADEIDFIVGIGAGSPALDRLEIEILKNVFSGRKPYLASPHGALGTWMSSGALRLVLGIAALERQVLFPTVVSGPLERELTWPNLVLAPLRSHVKAILTYSFATGGQSVAMVLKQGNLNV